MVVESGAETSTETTTGSVETPSAEVTEGADTASPEVPAEGAAGLAGAAVVPPAYQPNLTYRVRDPSTNRQVERKFEDWATGIAKDAETEKKLREFHEKAYGLDAVKSDRERLSGELQQTKQAIQQQYQPVMENVQQLAHHVEQRNFPAVFKMLNLQPQEVFKWAYNYANMTPEARQQMEQQSQANMQAYGAQNQMTQTQQQSLQAATEFKQRELGLIMRYDTQVSDAASDFDQQHGVGAFIEQVKRTGDYHWRMGQDISMEQAVREVMKLTGRGTPPQSQGQQAQIPGQGFQHQQQSAPLQAPARKPVIPSVQGTGTSPVKRVYTSMEDIRKRRQELEAAASNE